MLFCRGPWPLTCTEADKQGEKEWQCVKLCWPCVVCGKPSNLPPPQVSPRTSVPVPPQWGAPWMSGQGHQTFQPENRDIQRLRSWWRGFSAISGHDSSLWISVSTTCWSAASSLSCLLTDSLHTASQRPSSSSICSCSQWASAVLLLVRSLTERFRVRMHPARFPNSFWKAYEDKKSYILQGINLM